MNKNLLSPKTGKGLLLGLIASLFFCTGNASAQDYIGGSFSVQGSVVSSNGTTNTTALNIAPDPGWFIGDKWALGIRPWIGHGKASTSSEAENTTFSVGIKPYARYQLLAHNRFGLWAEADPQLSFTQNRSNTKNGLLLSKTRSTTWGVVVLPVLTYQLNRRIALETQLNLFSFSMLSNHTVHNDDDLVSSFTCGLSATTKDAMDTLGDISIGFVYKF